MINPQQPMKKTVFSFTYLKEEKISKQTKPIIIHYHVSRLSVGPDNKIIAVITQSWN